MSIICSKCGGTHIMCEAMIEPNTKKFDHYTDESFLYGWCDDCHMGTILTDVDEVKNDMDARYRVFKESYGVELPDRMERRPEAGRCKNHAVGRTCRG